MVPSFSSGCSNGESQSSYNTLKARVFALFVYLLADLLQNIHIRGQYERFDMTIDVRRILAFY